MRMLRRGVVASAVLALLLVAPAGRAWAGLKTKSLVGTWVGSWKNETFGSTGTLNVVVEQQGPTFVLVTWTISGSVFGCGPVGPVSGAFLKGGKNCGGEACFSGSKIFVKGHDDVFGDVTIKNDGKKFIGKGKNTCNGTGPPSYDGTAKLKGKTLTGKLKIQTSSGTATTTFTATQQ